MGFRYWFRAAFLCASFALVVWAMYSIRNHGLGQDANEVLAGQRVTRVSSNVEICETRVKALKTSSTKYYENGMSWFKKGEAPGALETKIDPVDMEKWFGHNCSLSTEDLRPVASNETQAATPVLTLNFIEGNPESVKQTPSGTFIWKQFSFRSPQLENALKDLGNLRKAGPDGRANPTDD